MTKLSSVVIQLKKKWFISE